MSCSGGIACNKVVAKLAAAARKPDAQTVVAPRAVEAWIATLPLRKVWGLGSSTCRKLREEFGAEQCRELHRVSQAELCRVLDERTAAMVFQRCRGIDSEPVRVVHECRSMSEEDSFRAGCVSVREGLCDGV
jgi:DNA polymerase IV